MQCKILHQSKGRIRVHLVQRSMSLRQADILEAYLSQLEGVSRVQVFERTCDAVIRFTCGRDALLEALGAFSYPRYQALAPEHSNRALNRQFEDQLVMTVLAKAASKLFLPPPARMCWSALRSLGYLRKGLACLRRGRVEVPVLDATAITVSLLRGNCDTAGSIMFLLKIGELLEQWSHKKSVGDLARAMSLNLDQVWLLRDGQELCVPIGSVQAGDQVVVRMGGMIPLDGKVLSGEAMVNQSSMTGESLPVRKAEGSYVYAGTVVEEGECVLQVDKRCGSGRYDRIVQMIEQSEKLKSAAESQASHLADRLAPYSLAATALTWLVTRNATRAISILMVDFSCALKLAIPISVLSAMREGRQQHIAVKGGKFLEAVAGADTIVFDKTGTLTQACPRVAQVIPFGGRAPEEMLRLAACLEEHYPHSMANAVVEEAKRRGLQHEERHSKVEYVVAHGISSRVDGEKVLIGSYHFIFQDEGCTIPEGELEAFQALPNQYSHLYLAISGVLAAVICVEDPLRPEAPQVVAQLHALGIRRVVMMTGDNENTAQMVARQVGVDSYQAGVLPEDKAAFIQREREAGHTVLMVGDGVNDSPALSQADAGIAMGAGAAIAREVADITLTGEDLSNLVTLRRLAQALMERIRRDYGFIMGFNGALIALGVAGALSPALSALLHNASTLAVSLRSMTDLLPQLAPPPLPPGASKQNSQPKIP